MADRFYDHETRESIYRGNNQYVAARVTYTQGLDVLQLWADHELMNGEVLDDPWGTGSLQI